MHFVEAKGILSSGNDRMRKQLCSLMLCGILAVDILAGCGDSNVEAAVESVISVEDDEEVSESVDDVEKMSESVDNAEETSEFVDDAEKMSESVDNAEETSEFSDDVEEMDESVDDAEETGEFTDDTESNKEAVDIKEHKIKKVTAKREDGSYLYEIEYEYDSNGNMLIRRAYKPGHVLDFWREYEYDNNGNMLTDYQYDIMDGEEVLLYINEYEYDSAGNLAKSSCHGSSGTLINEKEFDDHGNIIVWLSYDDYGDLRTEHRSEYEYDSVGNMTVMYKYQDDFLICTEEYDSHENPITIRHQNLDGSWHYGLKYEYDYDIDGNVIRRQSYYINEDGSRCLNSIYGDCEVTEFEYEYYE